MNKEDQKIWDLMTMQLSDGLPKPDKECFDQMLSSDKQMGEIYNILSAIHPDKKYMDGEALKNDTLQLTYQKMFAPARKVQNKKKNLSSGFILLFSVAALVTLVFNIGIKLFQNSSDIKMIEANTLPGIMSKVSLEDGTVVHLNSGSKLTYPARFSKKRREVTLQGEAYFEVARDASKPFIVSSGNTRTRVLGTAFNVRNYDSDPFCVISLDEGSVEFSALGSDIKTIMYAQDQLSFDKSGLNVKVKKSADTKSCSLWRNGQLIFTSVPFADMCRRLELHYNCRFEIENSELINQEFTGKFRNGETLEQIMEIIHLNTFVKYRIEGNTVTVY